MLIVITTLERDCPLIASDHLGHHSFAKGCNYLSNFKNNNY